jgi:hypothetical protein
VSMSRVPEGGLLDGLMSAMVTWGAGVVGFTALRDPKSSLPIDGAVRFGVL